jgi:hypothetical protein
MFIMIDANSQFLAILTNVGMAKQANADALGIAWKITDMGVGDGNPNGLADPPNPIPSATQTKLLNEWRRKPLNQLRIDPVNTAVIIAEQIIPADEGGKWIREMGLYDADGDLVAVANCAPSFKPLLSQGSGRTQVVRMNFIVSSAGNITLKIDPAVVLATREYVDSRIQEELYKLDSKQSVRVATTAPIALAGLLTIDGVVLAIGDRVLVKNQTLSKDNGLYVAASGAWARAADADNSAEVTSALLVSVEQGAALADTRWQLVTDGAIVLGVTPLTFQNVTQGFAPLSTVGNLAGGRGLTAAAQLTASDFGWSIGLGGVSSYTVTLPDVGEAPSGGVIMLHGRNSAGVVVASKTGSQISPQGATLASITINAGESAAFVREGGVWVLYGTAALRYSSVMSGPNWLTQPRFDNTDSFATTKFTNEAMGGLRRAVYSLSQGQVITPVMVNSLIYAGGTVNSATLPLLSSVPVGSTLTFAAMSSGIVLQRQGADTIWATSVSPTIPSININLGDTLTLTAAPFGWTATGGSAMFAYQGTTGAFGASLGAAGYHKHPSGKIEQYGVTGPIAAGASVTVTLPMAFPNAQRCGFAQANGVSPTLTYAATVSLISNSQIAIYNPPNSANQAISYSWRTEGH